MAIHGMIHIELAIPQEAQELVHAHTAEVACHRPNLAIPDVGQFHVQLMHVDVVSGDERERVQRAFAVARGYFQDRPFPVSTVTVRGSPDGRVVTLAIRSCRSEGEGRRGSGGYLGRLFSALHEALLEQGIAYNHMTRPGAFYPHVLCAWAKQEGTQVVLEETSIPANVQVRWRTSTADLLVS